LIEAAMTATAEPSVWTYAYDVLDGSQAGPAVVAIGGASDAAGNLCLAASNASFTVLAGATLALRAVTAAPALVVRGQTVSPVSVTVANSGDTSAVVSAIGLAFNDDVAGYVVTQLSGPLELAAQTTATFSFGVEVTSTAALGITTLDAVLAGADALTSRELVDTSADEPDSWTVDRLSADAGPERTGRVTTHVALDGSGSRHPLGGQLAYAWSFVTQPQGSSLDSSAILPVGSAQPHFRPARKGTYLLSLTVSDGPLTPATDTVNVVVENSLPDVSTSASASTTLGQSLTLTASGSDPDAGDPLSYSWSIASRPAASAATGAAFVPNDSALAATTQFTPNAEGVYLVEVRAGDSVAVSVPATVQVTVIPAPPRATIVPQNGSGGARDMVLDGSTSTGAGLIFSWLLTARPPGAAAFESTQPTTSYPAVRAGLYTFTLTVTDRLGRTSQTTLSASLTDEPPVADARGDRQLALTRPGTPAGTSTTLAIALDASASTDPNGETLTYAWRVVSAPEPGAVTLSAPDAAQTLAVFSDALRSGPGSPLIAAGPYRFAVTVCDGTSTSTDTVTVLALDPARLAPAADAGLDRTVRVRFAGGGLA
ncbi:MAG: PKD domain-containing protein, partial [Acidimicrobiaceae bacterium]